MPYCMNCGNAVEQLPEAVAAAIVASDDVEIARIQAERDVEVAKIQARQDKDWNETRLAETEIEAEASVERAEAEAEVIGEIIAAETGAPEEGDGAPVVLAAEPEEPEDDGQDLTPPEAEHHAAPAPSKTAWAF